MRKTAFVFLALFAVFCGLWAFKIKSAQSGISSSAEDTASVWWDATDTSVAVDSDWVLDPEIPENYIPVPGEDELYMVLGDDGTITEYRSRTQEDDGTWVWETVDPNIPDNYVAVEGLEDVYCVTDENGNVTYFKYIRNDDNSFAFIEVDENGNEVEDTPSGDTIPDNYLRVIGNTYAIYDENGVCIGYKERVLQDDGTYVWVDTEKPDITTPTNLVSYDGDETDSVNTPTPSPSTTITPAVLQPTSSTQHNENGTYTETETFITTETKNGYVITYQTIITRVYDSSGTLLSTKKEDPTEINRVKVGTGTDASTPDTENIADTLEEEVARVSAGLTYKEDMANEILALLNAERTGEGLSVLTMDTDSDSCQIAKIIAADMATYNYSDYETMTYGTLGDILTLFNVSSASPSENVWRATGDKTANDIDARFSLLESARNVRMSSSYTEVGIAVVSKNGYLYICEVYLH